VEIVSIKPYSSVVDHFSFFYAGVDGVKVVLNSRQQMPSQDMKMPRRYFRDMLANKLEMTLCDIEASV
jgi:hypothetical protein